MTGATKFVSTTLDADSIGYLVSQGEFSGVVHSVFAAACNLRREDELLTLGGAHIGNSPTTILVAGPTPDFRRLFQHGEAFVAQERVLRSARVKVRLCAARVWQGRPKRALLPPVTLKERARVASSYLATSASPFGRDSGVESDADGIAHQLASAVRKLDRNQTLVALQRLVGLGEGLTPAGDDFVVGLLAGLDAFPRDTAHQVFRDFLGAAVVALANRTTDVAAHFLRLAAQAHYAEALDDLRDTLLCEHRADLVQAALERLLQVGATSGADTLAGFIAALDAWLAGDIEHNTMTNAVVRFKVVPNLYKDSVTLMQVAAKLREREGIEQASCLMGTPANLAQLGDAGLSVETKVAPSDLLVVVRGSVAACDEALEAAHALLTTEGPIGQSSAEFSLPLTSIAAAVGQTAGANLALISVPGDYAAAEAMKALSLGLHVMLFSDNVPVAEERAIKQRARAKNLLVMGPDCGTAIVNGVPLGFANVVRRGDIGLVAASGTGLQEVTCRIHNLGGGVSQALGTGGRDLKEEIGGITMLQGLQALADDPDTRVIVLISKPPAPSIAREILRLAAAAGKPVVVHFLGAAPDEIRDAGLHAALSLRHAGDMAIALAQGAIPLLASSPPPAGHLAAIEKLAASMASSQRAVRAFFTGGTFCYEAQLAFLARNLPCRSNAPAHGAAPFEGRFEGHVFLDLGDDDYTRGRPHPMIDPSLRNDVIRTQGADPATAAILFDVVLGYGAHANPAQDLALALQAAATQARSERRSLALIGHVCGTDGDPQDKAAQIAQLKAVGAHVADSNVEAAMLAARVAAMRG